MQVQAHIQQELHSTLQTLWEESDPKLAAHVAALQTLGSTRAAVSASGYWHGDLQILEDVAKAVLSHGVAVLEASVAHWESAEDDWEMWRVDLCAASARHPVSAALASVHNGACTAMLQFANLTKMAQSLCNVTVADVHERCDAGACHVLQTFQCTLLAGSCFVALPMQSLQLQDRPCVPGTPESYIAEDEGHAW